MHVFQPGFIGFNWVHLSRNIIRTDTHLILKTIKGLVVTSVKLLWSFMDPICCNFVKKPIKFQTILPIFILDIKILRVDIILVFYLKDDGQYSRHNHVPVWETVRALIINRVKTSYMLVWWKFLLLWNLAGSSAALLLSCLSNFGAIGKTVNLI